MADGHYFNPNDTERISRVVRAFEAGMPGLPGAKRATPDRNYAIVPFRNDYAGTIPAYGVLRITGAVELDDAEYLTIDQPGDQHEEVYLVNGPEDVDDNGYGWGTYLWHGGRALYEGTYWTPEYGETWGPQSGSFKLHRGAPGFYICGAASGSPGYYVRAKQQSHKVVFAITDEELAQGDTASCRIASHNGENFYEDSSLDRIDVHDWFLNLTETIPAETKIRATLYQSNVWVLDFAYCDVTDTAPEASTGSEGDDTGGAGTGGSSPGGAVPGGADGGGGGGLGGVMLFGPDNFTEPGFLPQEAL